MMYNFPFYPHFPTKSYRSYPHGSGLKVDNSSTYPQNYPHKNVFGVNKANSQSAQSTKNTFSESFSIMHSRPARNVDNFYKNPQVNVDNCNLNTEKTDEKDEIFLEILGIKLYSDDILLLCLIFFLYKEGVQDEYLFIALIMLLLS